MGGDEDGPAFCSVSLKPYSIAEGSAGSSYAASRTAHPSRHGALPADACEQCQRIASEGVGMSAPLAELLYRHRDQ